MAYNKRKKQSMETALCGKMKMRKQTGDGGGEVIGYL